MSRSRRRKPFFSYFYAESDKPGKVVYNRVMRRLTRQLMKKDPELGQDLAPQKPDEVRDIWDLPKEGKHYRSPHISEDYLRKLMRK